MFFRGIFFCSIFVSSVYSFETVVCKEVRRSSKAQEGFKLPTFYSPHPPSGIPKPKRYFIRRNQRKPKKDEKRFLPNIHTKKVKPTSLEKTQVIEWSTELRDTYRVRDFKKVKALLALKYPPHNALITEEFLEWIHLREAVIDACRHGDLRQLQAALLLGKDRGITVNSSHNGRYPLGEASTTKCAAYLLQQGAKLYAREIDKGYTITNMHLSKLIFALQEKQPNPFRNRKKNIQERESIIKLLSENINEKEKKKLHKYWKQALKYYKSEYGELNYTEQLPNDSAFLNIIKTLVPLKK